MDLMASDAPLPADELTREENVALVQKVLSELSPLYREVLVLSFFHRFAYKEMADMLGVPLGTVKSRLHAAVAAFAKAFKAQEKRGK
jgi:RNA polymerase sigma-70 factor (ECF subfamily)